MIVSVGPDADRELSEGALHYARDGGPQLGLAFIAEFARVVELLGVHPEVGTHWGRGRRRFPLRRFPYSVVYYVFGDEVRIIALAHHRRKPGYWTSRR